MKIHIVQKGDTLWNIAKKYGVDFEELKKMNAQLSNPDMIMPGMKIKVPATGGGMKKEHTHHGAHHHGAHKEVPKAEHPFVQHKEVPLPVVQKPKEVPLPIYQPVMPQPLPEIDINNYYTMNMSQVQQQAVVPTPAPVPTPVPAPVPPKEEVKVEEEVPCPPPQVGYQLPVYPQYCYPMQPVMPACDPCYSYPHMMPTCDPCYPHPHMMPQVQGAMMYPTQMPTALPGMPVGYQAVQQWEEESSSVVQMAQQYPYQQSHAMPYADGMMGHQEAVMPAQPYTAPPAGYGVPAYPQAPVYPGGMAQTGCGCDGGGYQVPQQYPYMRQYPAPVPYPMMYHSYPNYYGAPLPEYALPAHDENGEEDE